jgi:hypothetical protein
VPTRASHGETLQADVNGVSSAAGAEAGACDMAGPDAGASTAATLAALRERHAHRADPVRFRFIEALARRAEGQPEAVRRLLDAKLAKALHEYLARYESVLAHDKPPPASTTSTATATDTAISTSTPASPVRHPAPPPTPTASPLAGLVQSLARTPAVTAGLTPHNAKRTPAAAPDLQTLDYFRHTWARLAVHRSMNQSLAKTPKNAGPLNSHRLVLRSLEVMREVSPAYLNRFVGYVDALLALDGMGGATPAPPPATTPPPEGEKKRKAARGAGASGRG